VSDGLLPGDAQDPLARRFQACLALGVVLAGVCGGS
jgi:hypothetical protein